MSRANLDPASWTYGVEHELVDWPRKSGVLPEGFLLDLKDVTMVNSNGIAVDPKAISYDRGGEICTPPSSTPEEQGALLSRWLHDYPASAVNYRSNLHVHVLVPGLSEDLERLKQLASFGYRKLPILLEQIEPIPVPKRVDSESDLAHIGAMRRYRRRRVSHHTVITKARLEQQLKARWPDEFFEAECPRDSDGKTLWHLAPRHAVNLRHMREKVPTIEFRHFPGTLDANKVVTCVEWCQAYLAVALDLASTSVLMQWQSHLFPQFEPYVHRLEMRYRKTCHDGTLTRKQIEENIKAILLEDAGA